MQKTSKFFYTEQQDMIIKHALFRGDNPMDIGRRYARVWNRTENAIASRAYMLKKKGTGAAFKKKPEVVVTEQKQVEQEVAVEEKGGIELPQGFVFTGTPAKVTLFKDHFRVYF